MTIFDSKKLQEYIIFFGYYTSLFSTTCFFLDSHQIVLLNTVIQFPVGIIFFPLTFAFSNIIQDRYGKTTANTIVFIAFIFDTLFVLEASFLSWLGDSEAHWIVFKSLPFMMLASWTFLGIGSIFNINFYAYLNKIIPVNNIFNMLLKFFVSISATELLASAMSVPFMFFMNGLSKGLILTTIIVATYKIIANAIITIGYWIFIRTNGIV